MVCIRWITESSTKVSTLFPTPASSSKQVAKKAVLSKKNTDALLFEIKRLVSLWADEGQMDGKRIFYWYIMTNNMMAEVAYRVPTTMEELAKCDLPQHVVDEYEERLIKSIKAFLEQTNVSFHDA